MGTLIRQRWNGTSWDLMHTDPIPNPITPPTSGTPVLVTGFGFNTSASTTAYTNSTSETASQMIDRLVSDYGPFGWTKTFYGSSFLPESWSALSQGENDPDNPAKHHIICFGWTPGTIANGSHDVTLTSFAQSVPAGKHVMLCMNEVDSPGRISNWPAYTADMDHMFDLFESLTLSAKVESWDCFMQYAVDPSSGPRFQDSWVNPAKRHGIIWDCYWNQYNVDSSGNLFVGEIETTMVRLGMHRWCLGEFGDRRPGSTGSNPAPDDATRATLLQAHITRLLAANPQPEGLVYFDYIGTTGDHRILRPPYGDDDATYAVLAAAVSAAHAAGA